MSAYSQRSANKLQLLGSGLLVVACLFLLTVIASAVDSFNGSAETQNRNADVAAMSGAYDDPNVVAGGMATSFRAFGYSTAAFGTALQDSFVYRSQTIVTTTGTNLATVGGIAYSGAARIVQSVGSTAGFLVQAAGQTISFAVHSIAGAVGFVGHTIGNAVSGTVRATRVNAIIKPADDTAIPIIDPGSPELAAALAAMPANGSEPQPPAAGSAAPRTVHNAGPIWPIHGDITTLFGVPHWPYQATHSGIDISDGTAPGTTPVKAFRAGTVSGIVHSGRGLGNHVIVDHGSGVTSVYAHLHSISVQTGQQVDTSTVLGTEGSTGASTGTHLHFEIRVNGQAADPRQFVSGQP